MPSGVLRFGRCIRGDFVGFVGGILNSLGPSAAASDIRADVSRANSSQLSSDPDRRFMMTAAAAMIPPRINIPTKNLFIIDLPSLARFTGCSRWYDCTEMPLGATSFRVVTPGCPRRVRDR